MQNLKIENSGQIKNEINHWIEQGFMPEPKNQDWSQFSDFVENNEHLFGVDFLQDDGSQEAACRYCVKLYFGKA